MRPEKLAEFLEATYALELPDEPWLRGVSNAARDVWGLPGMTFSSFYDVSDPTAPTPSLVVSDGVPEGLAAIFFRSNEEHMTPELATRFRHLTAASIRSFAPELVPVFEETKAFGLQDGLALYGRDPNGVGCMITIGADRPVELANGTLSIFQRMAFHLAAAFRCRQRLQAGGRADPTAGAEAVLDPAGRVVHAEGPAQSASARARLKEAARWFDRARTRAGRAEAVVGLGRHHPVVDARWTLVDLFERGGARYIVARENQAAVQGLGVLTDRERQVVAFLALGRSTKEIAYTLGISDSTARVLLSRAAGKLGARTRAELVELVSRPAPPSRRLR